MSFWTDDIAGLLADFGVPVTQASRIIGSGLFDRAYAGVGDIPVESYSPAVTCRSADVAELEHGDSVTVDGSDYTIRSIQPDGTGITVLILEAAT